MEAKAVSFTASISHPPQKTLGLDDQKVPLLYYPKKALGRVIFGIFAASFMLQSLALESTSLFYRQKKSQMAKSLPQSVLSMNLKKNTSMIFLFRESGLSQCMKRLHQQKFLIKRQRYLILLSALFPKKVSLSPPSTTSSNAQVNLFTKAS